MALRTLSWSVLTFCFSFSLASQSLLPRFHSTGMFDEQEMSFVIEPGIHVLINAPPMSQFDPKRNIKLLLYALPNGNTIAQTIGKIRSAGDDWHFDIQHIGAQTRFVRALVKDCSIVIAYLQTEERSWPLWRRQHRDNEHTITALVDSLRHIFEGYSVTITLSGHSGGGSFIFGYINAMDSIPDWIERIAFLDATYGYDENLQHGAKLLRWLRASDNHVLSVLAYNDSVALLDGKPFVSATGGAWYRSLLLRQTLERELDVTTHKSPDFQISTALNGRVKFFFKENPAREILHTVQVERNGFIQSVLSGTPYEGVGYRYYGDRAYGNWIQSDTLR